MTTVQRIVCEAVELYGYTYVFEERVAIVIAKGSRLVCFSSATSFFVEITAEDAAVRHVLSYLSCAADPRVQPILIEECAALVERGRRERMH